MLQIWWRDAFARRRDVCCYTIIFSYYNVHKWKRKVFAFLKKRMKLSKIKKNQNSLTVLMSRFAVKEL